MHIRIRFGDLFGISQDVANAERTRLTFMPLRSRWVPDPGEGGLRSRVFSNVDIARGINPPDRYHS
jgi:hypothetical protein